MWNDSTIIVDTTYTLQRDSVVFTKTDKVAGAVATSLWLFGAIVFIMIFTMKGK